jgi:hypothetical protein
MLFHHRLISANSHSGSGCFNNVSSEILLDPLFTINDSSLPQSKNRSFDILYDQKINNLGTSSKTFTFSIFNTPILRYLNVFFR